MRSSDTGADTSGTPDSWAEKARRAREELEETLRLTQPRAAGSQPPAHLEAEALAPVFEDLTMDPTVMAPEASPPIGYEPLVGELIEQTIRLTDVCRHALHAARRAVEALIDEEGGAVAGAPSPASAAKGSGGTSAQ